MLLSAVSVLVVAQSSSEIPEGIMNNPVYSSCVLNYLSLFVNISNTALVKNFYRRVCRIEKSNYNLHYVRGSVLSVRLSSWNNLAPIGWVLMKFGM